MNVIVIGAGMAGLAAAHKLTREGLKVVVLEARDRIGGRIHTVRGFAKTSIELGAELIHGSNVPTWELVRGFELPTRLAVSSGSTRAFLDGRWTSLQEMGNSTSVLEKLQAVKSDHDLSLLELTKRAGLARREWTYELYNYELEHEAAEKLSGSVFLEEALDGSSGAEGADSQVVGGYDQLPRGLARGLDIRLNSVVTEVDWSGDVVKVLTDSGTRFAASRVVVTLPLGVLKANKVRFSPVLPEEKRRAIAGLGFNNAAKVFFRFNERIFANDVLAWVTPDCTPTYWWTCAPAKGSEDVVVGWNAGSAANDLHAMGEEKALRYCLETLRHLTRHPDLEPTARRISHWRDDPYTLGGYSYDIVGQGEARAQLGKAVADKLYWAGEAVGKDGGSSIWASSVHGAYASGLYAASQLLTNI